MNSNRDQDSSVDNIQRESTNGLEDLTLAPVKTGPFSGTTSSRIQDSCRNGPALVLACSGLYFVFFPSQAQLRLVTNVATEHQPTLGVAY